WLAKFAADPYDPEARGGYAAWLRGRGKGQEARQHGWMAQGLRGGVQGGLVFSRRGLGAAAPTFWDAPPPSARTYSLPCTADYFAQNPDLLFIVVTEDAPSYCGFRRENGSKRADQGISAILWWWRGHGCKARVLVTDRRRPLWGGRRAALGRMTP